MEISSKGLSLNKKLKILADAAKYDVACTSSGSSRRGKKGMLGNTEAAGICHSFAQDGRCISLLKILYTNECVFLRMGAVCLCLRSYLAMNVFMIVSIV